MINSNLTIRMIKNMSWLMLFFCISTTYAQQTVSLSLVQAKEYALQHNKSYQKSQNAVEEAFYSRRETLGSLIPQVKVAADYSNFLGAELSLPFGPGGSSLPTPYNPTSNLQGTVSQLLFNGNAIIGAVLSNLALEMSSLNVENSVLALKQQVGTSYFSVLLSQATKDILQKNYENIKDVYAKTKSMADAGVVEQIDADQLMVQVNSIENLVKNSDRNIEISNRFLKILLGLGVNDSIVLTNAITDIITGANDFDILLMEYDLNQDPSYKIVELSEKIADKNLLMSKLNLLPTVSMFYSYTEKILKPTFDMSPKHVFGISASVPLFTGMTNHSKIKKARIGVENANLDKQMLVDNLLTQERQLRSNLSTAMEQYATQKLNIDVAERVLSSVQLKYDQGVKSSLDLTTANTNYIKAQSDYLSSMMQLFDARTALEKMLGSI